jgi:zinc transporter ZupT
MTQRRINVAVFSFLGVILGILLATYASYSTISEFVLAMAAGGLLGGLVGANWTPTSDHRRPRSTSR